MSICVYLQATQVELRFANREKYELEKRVETQQSMMDNMHRQLLGIQSEFELSGEGQGKHTWVHGYMFGDILTRVLYLVQNISRTLYIYIYLSIYIYLHIMIFL